MRTFLFRLAPLALAWLVLVTAAEAQGVSSGGAFIPTDDIRVSGQWLFKRTTNPICAEGATDDAFEICFTFNDPTSDNVWTWQAATDTVVGRATTDTLSNKSLTAPVFSGSVTGTYTLAGTPTITAPAISSPVLSGTATGTYTLAGTPTITAPAITSPTFADDTVLTIGTGTSIAYKDDATSANTTVASVVLGTPVTPAVAADTLFIANQIADGDLLLATQTGGNTQAAMFVDGSAGTVNFYGAGVRQAQVDASSLNLGVAGTTLGRLEISGNT